MRINREDLLKELDAVYPGLTPREIIEHSSCFVFCDGNVMTFSGEIACTHKSVLNVTGAVQAAPLLALLRKMTEEEIEITQTESALVIKGRNKTADIHMEAEIMLPVHEVEKPKGWKKLDTDFAEGLKLVGDCAGKDQSEFRLTCVHITPEHLEATDRYQIARFNVETPVKENICVRRDSLKHVIDLGMTKMSETATWIHFQNGAGLVFSCRRNVEDFPLLDSFIELSEGKKTSLPKGLGEAADKAEIFSSENADRPDVMIELRKGKLRITGEGASGKYRETKKIAYTGPSLVFTISPKLLTSITKEHQDCEISEGKLKVDTGKFTYVACLQSVED